MRRLANPRVLRPWLLLSLLMLPGFGPPSVLPSSPKEKGERPLMDCFGDPLPAGAVLRFGTIRFRSDRLFGGDTGLAFSPDGKTIAAAVDEVVLLWDAASGKPLLRLRPERWGFHRVAFSPEGKILAAASYDRVALWELPSGRPIGIARLAPEGKRGPGGVLFLQFASGGKKLLAAGADGSLRVADLAGDKGVQVVPGPKTKGGTKAAALSPDGKLVASVADEPAVRVWDAATGRELRRLEAGPVEAHGLAFSPDGTALAAPDGPSVRLWDPATGREIRALRWDGEACWAVAFSPGGKVLAAGDGDGWVRTWDVTSGRKLKEFRGHPDGACSLVFSPNGKALAVGGGDETLRLWDPASGNLPVPREGGHTRLVGEVGHFPGGGPVASLGADSRLYFWDPHTGRAAAPPVELDDRAGALACSPDGHSVALGFHPARVRVWDRVAGREACRIELGGVFTPSVSFSPDGARLAVAWGGGAGVWDPRNGRKLLRLGPEREAVWSIRYAPDGRTIAGVISGPEKSCRLCIWGASTGREVRSSPPAEGHCRELKFSPDGRFLAAGTRLDRDEVVGVWEVATARPMMRLKTDDEVHALTFLPRPGLLATGGRAGKVEVWDIFTGKRVRKFDGEGGQVICLSLAPDGRTLVAGYQNTTLLAWRLPADRPGPRPGRLPASEEALARYWAALDSSEGDVAYRAIAALVACEGAPAFVRKRVVPPTPPDAALLAKLLKGLGNDRFQVRRDAERELAKIGELAAPALRKRLAANPSADERDRIERLLRAAEEWTPERLRLFRAVQVLEVAGGPDAKAALEALARGPEGLRAADEARAALARLERKR